MDLGQYLDELTDGDGPLARSGHEHLSSPQPEDMAQVQRTWPRIPADRRAELIGILAELAEDTVELDFSDVLRMAIGDPCAAVRGAAARGLWECEDRAVIRPLLELLAEDAAVEVRAAAATALGRFADLAHEGRLLSRDEARIQKGLMAAIGRGGEEMEVRRRAIEAIAGLDSPDRDRIIRAAYESGDAGLLQSAVYAMGRSSNAKWLSSALRETAHDSPAIRYEAAVACGLLGGEDAAPRLVALAQDEDPQVQLAAVKALGEVGGSLARRALQRCMELGDDALKQAAEEAIANIEFDDDPLALGFRA